MRLFLLLLLPGCLIASPPSLGILVATDVTEAGRAARMPREKSPVYYVAVAGGFQEFGAVIAGEKSPARSTVDRVLAAALARAGYHPASEQTPPPALLLVYAWGTLNPVIDEIPGSGEPPRQVFYNQAQMLAFVGADQVASLPDSAVERERVVEAARSDLYFMIVTAYDAAALAQKGERILLWRTKITLPSQGRWLPAELPAMIASGSPHFGRATERPVWVDEPEHRRTQVLIRDLIILGTVESDKISGPGPKPATPPRGEPSNPSPPPR